MGAKVSPRASKTRAFRAALLGSIVGASSVSLSPAIAQEQSSTQPTTETIIVTGSRIPQANLKSVSPIQVVNDQEFKLPRLVLDAAEASENIFGFIQCRNNNRNLHQSLEYAQKSGFMGYLQ